MRDRIDDGIFDAVMHTFCVTDRSFSDGMMTAMTE
jgi:hypothetical protein